ncbi:hypothetical protein ACFX13_037567 [Malus domestica]
MLHALFLIGCRNLVEITDLPKSLDILEIEDCFALTDQDFSDTVPLHCSLVSNFSAYVSPEAASQSATTTTWGFGVTAVAFDPTRGGSVIAVVIVEGQYMSPCDPDEGPSITGWRVQRWESSLQPVVLHQIFGNPTSSFGGQAPMQTVWLSKVDTSIQPTNDFKSHQAAATTATTDARKTPDSGIEKVKRVSFDPFDLSSDVRTLAQIVYSAHGGEIAVAFLRGGVHIFSGSNFAPVDNYKINVGAAIAAPAFSSTSCCSASVWYDSVKDRTVLKIIRVLPPTVPSSQVKANSSTSERAIAERFWWSLFVGVDWWDVVGCTRSAAEDGIVSLNSVIAVLDANFHSLPSAQHRQRFGPCLDRLKCRLLEGTKAQEVRAMVLDKQAGLLNPSALVPEPWQASGETLSGIDPEATAVEPALVPHVQNMPRPRGADAAGLLLRELELRPPAEERGRRNMYGEPWSGPDDMGPQDDTTKLCNSSDPLDSGSLESCDVYYGADGLLPRKRGMSERDAAFGLNTYVGLGQCFKRQRHRRSGSW